MLRSVAAAGFKVNNDVQIDHENVAKNPIELKEGGEGRCAICCESLTWKPKKKKYMKYVYNYRNIMLNNREVLQYAD